MRPSGDLPGEMDVLDHATAERILNGRIGLDDAPPGYAGVVTLLAAVAEVPAAPAVSDRMTVEAMASAIAALPPYVTPAASPAERLRSRMAKGRVIAAVVFASMVGTTSLAFAGDLGPAQGAAHHLFAKFGINVPSSHGSKGHTHGNSGSNWGSQISRIAHQSPSPGPGKGPQVCIVASQGKCQAGQQGGSGDQGSNGGGQGNGGGNGGGQGSGDQGSSGSGSGGGTGGTGGGDSQGGGGNGNGNSQGSGGGGNSEG
jgi:hypothetical protein